MASTPNDYQHQHQLPPLFWPSPSPTPEPGRCERREPEARDFRLKRSMPYPNPATVHHQLSRIGFQSQLKPRVQTDNQSRGVEPQSQPQPTRPITVVIAKPGRVEGPSLASSLTSGLDTPLARACALAKEPALALALAQPTQGVPETTDVIKKLHFKKNTPVRVPLQDDQVQGHANFEDHKRTIAPSMHMPLPMSTERVSSSVRSVTERSKVLSTSTLHFRKGKVPVQVQVQADPTHIRAHAPPMPMSTPIQRARGTSLPTPIDRAQAQASSVSTSRMGNSVLKAPRVSVSALIRRMPVLVPVSRDREDLQVGRPRHDGSGSRAAPPPTEWQNKVIQRTIHRMMNSPAPPVKKSKTEEESAKRYALAYAYARDHAYEPRQGHVCPTGEHKCPDGCPLH
jgi:hypothetical protein